ncbi:hypothetical protein V8D89_014806, partial [Ganoderma adspersum]
LRSLVRGPCFAAPRPVSAAAPRPFIPSPSRSRRKFTWTTSQIHSGNLSLPSGKTSTRALSSLARNAISPLVLQLPSCTPRICVYSTLLCLILRSPRRGMLARSQSRLPHADLFCRPPRFAYSPSLSASSVPTSPPCRIRTRSLTFRGDHPTAASFPAPMCHARQPQRARRWSPPPPLPRLRKHRQSYVQMRTVKTLHAPLARDSTDEGAEGTDGSSSRQWQTPRRRRLPAQQRCSRDVRRRVRGRVAQDASAQGPVRDLRPRRVHFAASVHQRIPQDGR